MQIQAKIGGILYDRGGNRVVITRIYRVRNLGTGPGYPVLTTNHYMLCHNRKRQ